MRFSRIRGVAAVTLALAAIGLGFFLWPRLNSPRHFSIAPPVTEAPQTAPPQASEPKLAPVTLSPQRMQSIGVKTGVVERRPVKEDIRAVGNIEANETRLADVQVRFSGWVQKVFADATYKTARRGQPLFTIYSPDVVATEQEYLVARELSAHGGHHGSRSHDMASLLDAATARLQRWQIPEREIARLRSSRNGQP